MRLAFTLLLLSLFHLLPAQTKTMHIPVYRNGDTSLWFQWKVSKNPFGLSDLRTERDTFHYRIDLEGQLVDVWTVDRRVFHGSVYSYINSYEPYNMRTQSQKPSTFYSRREEIDTAQARAAFALLAAVDSIPPHDSIPGWNGGCDGVTYCIERSTPASYSFADYWTPSAFPGIPEARAVQQLVEQLKAVLKLEERKGAFYKTLAPGSYSNGYGVMMILTDRQAKRWQNKQNRQNADKNGK